jgi:FHA domain-containing protein
MLFPEKKTVAKPQPFSAAMLEKTLNAVFKLHREFSGYLRIQCGEEEFFLFFLKNAAYAAGRYCKRRPESLTLRDFFAAVLTRPAEGMLISLHETDQGLLKELLIFMQVVPSVKAPVSLIDLNAIVDQIDKEGADALVVLESDGFHNFFFFLGGCPATAHFSESSPDEEGLAVDEQMLLYAYRPGTQVEANIYRHVSTAHAPDFDDGSHAAILAMLHEAPAPQQLPVEQTTTPPPSVSLTPKSVQVTITEGTSKGTSRTGRLPFTIGRKEGDMVIADPLISRRHAVIREINEALVVEDLGSTNGTFVNGVEVKLQQLAPGDSITVGSTVVRITLV